MGEIHVLRAILVVTLLATMCAQAQAQSYEQLEKWCHDDKATDDQTIQGCSAVIASGRESGEKLSRVYYDRGLAFLDKNQLAPAIEDFDEAIRLNPKDADAFSARGDAHRLNRDPFRATNDYDRAIALKPDDAGAYKSRGFLYAAMADLNNALRIDPKKASSLFGRGVAKRRMGDTAGGDADIAAAKALSADVTDGMEAAGVRP